MEMRRLLVKLSILFLVSCKSIASISDVITVDKEDKIVHVEKPQEKGKKSEIVTVIQEPFIKILVVSFIVFFILLLIIEAYNKKGG